MHVSVPLCHRSSFVQFCSWNYDVSYDIGVKIACKTDFGLKFSLVVFNLVYWEKYDELKSLTMPCLLQGPVMRTIFVAWTSDFASLY